MSNTIYGFCDASVRENSEHTIMSGAIGYMHNQPDGNIKKAVIDSRDACAQVNEFDAVIKCIESILTMDFTETAKIVVYTDQQAILDKIKKNCSKFRKGKGKGVHGNRHKCRSNRMKKILRLLKENENITIKKVQSHAKDSKKASEVFHNEVDSMVQAKTLKEFKELKNAG